MNDIRLESTLEGYLFDLVAGRLTAANVIESAKRIETYDGCVLLSYLLNNTFRSDIFMSEIIETPPTYSKEEKTNLFSLIWKKWISIYSNDSSHHVFFSIPNGAEFHRDVIDLPNEHRKAWRNTSKKERKEIEKKLLPSAAVFHDLLININESDNYTASYHPLTRRFVVSEHQLPLYTV